MAEKNPISSYDIVKYPLTTEKSINMIARNNSLSFVVDKRSKSPEIKKAIEELMEERLLMSGFLLRIQHWILRLNWGYYRYIIIMGA